MSNQNFRALPSKGEGGMRVVKLDYSETYRDNDNLDDSLTSRLQSLQKVHFRAAKEKGDEIEELRKDVEKIQSLKDVVNQRDSTKEISNLFSKHIDGDEYSGINGTGNDACRLNRRLQKIIQRFSAKNHFNVLLPKWNPMADISENKKYVPLSVQIQKANISTPDGDLKPDRSKGYMQMTSSSRHHLARPQSVPANLRSSGRTYSISEGRSQSASQSRSRRQLQELSHIELSWSEPKIFTASDQRQSILVELRKHQSYLQTRVSSFVTDLDRFNRRNERSALSKYIDIHPCSTTVTNSV